MDWREVERAERWWLKSSIEMGFRVRVFGNLVKRVKWV